MLVIGLVLPRGWLHVIGVFGCLVLGVKMYLAKDGPMLLLQVSCLIAHVFMLVKLTVRSRRPR